MLLIVKLFNIQENLIVMAYFPKNRKIDLVLGGWRALRFLAGHSWLELGVEMDALSSPGVLGMSPPDFFFLKRRNRNHFCSAGTFNMLGRKHLWAQTFWDKGNTVHNICLGCGPSKFLSCSTVGNAASSNYPSTPKTNKQKALNPGAEKEAMLKCLKVLGVFSSGAASWSAGKVLAVLPFLTTQVDLD